jgi:hypothetical protein
LIEGAPHGVEPDGKKWDLGRLIGRTKGGMNTKLHTLADANGGPLRFFMTAGPVSDRCTAGLSHRQNDRRRCHRLLSS